MADEKLPSLDAIKDLSPAALGDTRAELVHVQRFLQRFGYLERGAYEPQQLDKPTADALRTYQERNSLETTGEFDAGTRDLMTESRCALPDMLDGVAFATRCAWNRRELTYTFDIGTNDTAGTTEFDAVRRALRTWSAAVPIGFTEVTAAQNPDIRIGWRPANDPDLSMVGGTLAHADFPPGCGVVTNAMPKPVHFDDEEHNWSVGAAADSFDVDTVALHELGHILGLGHSSVSGSVMFPTVRPNFTLQSLTADDLSGVRALYPERAWQRIGHANDVAAMTALNNKLYCATRDNSLWMRDPGR
ncbi:matrixin family metalloprotease [Streptomyces sp. R35]|uniref:Matrixin family metalloprotease n=1 Tax=Streptomyces sp. R35 TaxID=3238630 RepID=A0AB39SPZ9_9ACTN